MRRKRRNATVAQPAKTRSELEALHGRVWDTAELARDYVLTGIIFPYVVVRRKQDDAVGTLEYQAGPPCLYYDFVPQAAAVP
jgi:hypothetical protein